LKKWSIHTDSAVRTTASCGITQKIVLYFAAEAWNDVRR